MIIYNGNDFDNIVFELINGKTIIIPTDTQYGLISLDINELYKIKRRNKNKKIIKFVKDYKLIETKNSDFTKLAKKFWPGKLTLILNGESYRKPNNELILKLLDRFEVLYCTSANISGMNPITCIEEAKIQFKKNLDSLIFIKSDKKGDNIASTIYDIDNKKIIREGIISLGEIYEEIQ